MENDVKAIITQALRDRTKTLKRKVEQEYNQLIKQIYQDELIAITHINLNNYELKKKGA